MADYTDFDSQAADITRRRTLAALLQKQGAEGVAPPAKGVMHWTQTLGPALSAALGSFQQHQLDTQDQDLAAQRDTATKDWLGRMPQGTPGTPAAESNVPQPGEMGPPAQGEGQAFLPKIADPTKMLAWGTEGTKYGPRVAKIAENVSAQAMKDIADPYEKVGKDMFDRTTGQFYRSPESIAEEKNRLEMARQTLDAKHDIALQNANTAQDRQRADQQWKEGLLALKQGMGAGGAGGHVSNAGFDAKTDARVVQTKDGVQYRIDPATGLREKEPFTGQVVPASSHEKMIKDAQEARVNLDGAKSMLAEVLKTPGAYGTTSAFAASLPGVAGAWASEKLLTDEQRQARASLAMQAAEITHRLYGSAFSAGEQLRAEPFIVKPNDPPHVVINKLQTMQRMAEIALANKGANAASAAAVRFGQMPGVGVGMGGGPPPGGAPAAGMSVDDLVKKHSGQ